jgi:hypothetical protein
MPAKVDKQVQAIIESCMEKGDKTKKECEDMAWAIVNSNKDILQRLEDDNKQKTREDN